VSRARRYVIGPQVRDLLGPGPAEQVLTGRAGPAAYSCLLCDRRGDAAREQTTVLIMAEDRGDILAYAHARCAASQVTTFAAVTAARQAHGTADPAPATPDILLAWCGPYAALVADEPATPVMLTGDGAVNLALATWLSQGFALAVADTVPPPLPAGWAVHLHGRTLHGITAPDGWWWQADPSGQATELPAGWLGAARQLGAVAILAGEIGLDDNQLGPATDAAISAGKVAYGLAPVAGDDERHQERAAAGRNDEDD
jgi:hypothetical protein